MTEENPYTVQDLISLSYEQKPIDFSDAFNSLISNKIADAIDDRKLEVAQTMFAAPGEVEVEDESVEQFEEEEDNGEDA
jgi:hypothetical protein